MFIRAAIDAGVPQRANGVPMYVPSGECSVDSGGRAPLAQQRTPRRKWMSRAQPVGADGGRDEGTSWVSRGASVAVADGRPVWNTRVGFCVDDRLRPVEPGDGWVKCIWRV